MSPFSVSLLGIKHGVGVPCDLMSLNFALGSMAFTLCFLDASCLATVTQLLITINIYYSCSCVKNIIAAFAEILGYIIYTRVKRDPQSMIASQSSG
jgi:hypothetical protein